MRSADRKWLVISGWWLVDAGMESNNFLFICVVRV